MQIAWRNIDSDAAIREGIPEASVSKRLVLEDARFWGLLELQDGRAILVGYAGLGLKPKAQVSEDRLLIGIDGVVASYDLERLEEVFRFNMPTVFHDFISRTFPLVVLDEVGFVCIDRDGASLWEFLTDGPIEAFSFAKGEISGRTIDGTNFCFRPPLLVGMEPGE